MGRAGVVPSFGTTASVAMDEAGNAVAMMHSNGNSSGVVTSGLGFLYNNHMHNFNPRPGFRNSVAAGKYHGGVGRTDPRLAQRSAVSGDQPLLAGQRHCETQVFLNVVEFGMSPRRPWHSPGFTPSTLAVRSWWTPDFPPDADRGIEALGTQQVVHRSRSRRACRQ